ncbi:flagellar biosynthesis anti-sigma factor FlgM [Candidatus Endoriftia persephone str. Guaymas]|jgi:negative regulator of flagellin synthesis FlgM|uniref:Negative regulator of flagellin synthesis n=3 Tax=Gammaproteobacteria TaxID=1236 RepID=G2FB37_9GAMM|nr:flagellar biosynthesis anti-sigma factor FlgM [Candidatus Endoriftia persephone]EGV51093.1 Negative regulator of flagellin synthesis flgM [endosymbiont of Riftia pachyptila (vent Ph05)]EGW55975.1 hypothetical protein TevJSym_aa01190 [endosymbiont of Tevnia jerichonana (vent Tica)]MBA1332471.1 flagellar biosynthesis anti-sigma factor FlgM [Candidatus Endoriftia persephone str. Guaymas]USF88107.1 flagellar biosynthesis anti-sigma factor FlgM [Candidatus Endoriftia persephone]
MAIEISSLSSSALQGTIDSASANRANQPSETTRATPGRQADSVSLTSSASQLQQLEQKISKMPVVDAQRVESTQRSLATGSYKVNPDDSAENLLEMERALA